MNFGKMQSGYIKWVQRRNNRQNISYFQQTHKRFFSNHRILASLSFGPYLSLFYPYYPPINKLTIRYQDSQTQFYKPFPPLRSNPHLKTSPTCPILQHSKKSSYYSLQSPISKTCEQYILFQEQNHFHQANIRKITDLSASQYPRNDIHQKLQRQGPKQGQPYLKRKHDCNGVDLPAQNEEIWEQVTSTMLSVDMERIMATFWSYSSYQLYGLIIAPPENWQNFDYEIMSTENPQGKYSHPPHTFFVCVSHFFMIKTCTSLPNCKNMGPRRCDILGRCKATQHPSSPNFHFIHLFTQLSYLQYLSLLSCWDEMIYIIKQQAMSFYYILHPSIPPYQALPAIYYLPSPFQQPATNLANPNTQNPSHIEEKQKHIIQASFATRDSLQQDSSDRPIVIKKKKAVKKEKDENFGWRNQNKDRNILSNILKAFVNHLLEGEGVMPYLQFLHQKLDLESDVSLFREFVRHSFPTSKSYISPKQVKKFLRSQGHAEGLMIVFKLALARFLRMDYGLILLKSTKVKRRSKLEQMKRSRDLLQALFRD